MLLLGVLSGCGGKVDSGPALVPVTGKVILDGKPLVGATVTFNPTQGTPGNGAFGVTDAEGKFTLTDYSLNPGCPAGDYGVTFSRMTQPDGSPIPNGANRGEVGMVEQMPTVYTIFKPHAIIQGAKVPASGAQFDFLLDSKLRPPPSLFQ